MGRDQQSWSKCHCWTWCCVRSGQCSRIEMGKQWLGASCWEGNIQNWLLLAHRSDKTCILRFGNTGRPRKVVLLLLSLLFFFEFFLEENPSFWIEFFCWIAMAFFKVSVRGLHRAKTSIHSYQAHFNSPILTTSLCRLLEKACGISLLFPLRLTCELNSLLFLYIRIFWENFKPCAVLEKNRKCLCGHKAKAYTFFPCTIWRIRPQKKKKKKKKFKLCWLDSATCSIISSRLFKWIADLKKKSSELEFMESIDPDVRAALDSLSVRSEKIMFGSVLHRGKTSQTLRLRTSFYHSCWIPILTELSFFYLWWSEFKKLSAWLLKSQPISAFIHFWYLTLPCISKWHPSIKGTA